MDTELELRRHRAGWDNTVSQAIVVGYRLRVKCLACERARPIDLRKLESRFGDRILEDLKLVCTPCQRKGRRTSIHPPGRDVYISGVFPGEVE